MTQTKDVKLSDGTVLKVRGRTYPELLDRKKDGSESERQYEWFATCSVEPKLTVEEAKKKIVKINDGIAVAKAINSLEEEVQDFQESSQVNSTTTNQ